MGDYVGPNWNGISFCCQNTVYGFINGAGPFSETMFSRNELPEDAREVRGKVIENRKVTFDTYVPLAN